MCAAQRHGQCYKALSFRRCCYAGRMLIEKLMSGLYMGECARRLLLSFARHASLFNGEVPAKLTEANSFGTAGA